MRLPFHAEHIGSFIRPHDLLEARKKYGDGSEELEQAETKAISDLVKKEVEYNVTSITDGEYRRNVFYDGFFEKIPGFKLVHDVPMTDFKMTPVTRKGIELGMPVRQAVFCTGKIQNTTSPNMAEWEALKSLVPRERWKDCKLTIPSPTWHHFQLPPHLVYSDSAYSSDEEFFADLTAVYRAELQNLYDAGLRSVQIDDPNLTFFFDDAFQKDLQARGEDPAKLLDLYINVHNDCIKGRPPGLHVGVHLCRGNWGGVSFVEGSYEPIAEKLFIGLQYDTFFLEYDTPNAGDFKPLRFLPADRNVVLGLISTKSPEIEDVDSIVGRVHEAADLISRAQGRPKAAVMEQIGVSPQCGFTPASEAKVEGFNEEIMWKKLMLVRDVSLRVWPESR